MRTSERRGRRKATPARWRHPREVPPAFVATEPIERGLLKARDATASYARWLGRFRTS